MPPSTRRPLYRRAQLERLLNPSSIAIVGASERAGAFGERTQRNLAGFAGRLHLVNARYDRLGELYGAAVGDFDPFAENPVSEAPFVEWSKDDSTACAGSEPDGDVTGAVVLIERCLQRRSWGRGRRAARRRRRSR